MLTCHKCDMGQHGLCNGTCVYVDQDGRSKYVCECFCRAAVRAAQRQREAEAKVRKLMRELGIDRTHELTEKAKVEI